MFFGTDFLAARSLWLYPTEKQQGFWRSVGIFLLLAVLNQLVFGIIFAVIIYVAVFHPDAAALEQLKNMRSGIQPDNAIVGNVMVSALLATFPSGVLTAFIGVPLSHLGLPNRQGKLPLHWPQLGALGWVLVVGAFLMVTAVLTGVLAAGIGIDTSVYETCKNGVVDAGSKAGEVEKALAALAAKPHLYVFAALAAIVGAPLAEEVMFRGILFAGLANSKVGWPGAAIISAGAWAALHGATAPLYFVGMLFLMGLVLSLLLLRFGSISVTIACHMVWNAIVTYVSYVSCTPQ